MNRMSAPQLIHVANLIRRYLRSERWRVPSLRLLVEFLGTAFYASMRSEEARRIVSTLAFVDPRNPSGPDPKLIRPQRRTYVPFEQPLAFNIRNLVKLSQAAPPWAACIAVGASNGQLRICGLFDQEIHYRNSLNQEEGDRFGRPGLFQLEITGVGSFAIHENWRLIATLIQNTAVSRLHDVLHIGPLAKALCGYFSRQEAKVRELFDEERVRVPVRQWREVGRELWLRTLSRILLNVKRSNHGGALLLIPRHCSRDLHIKYGIHYAKLEDVLPQHIVKEICKDVAWGTLHDRFFEPQEDHIPTDLYFAESVSSNDMEDAVKAEVGCVNFIASLTRVDGLVLLSGGFVVRGFGVEITRRQDPPEVFIAGDDLASRLALRPLDFSHFGTRHRSMMRFCCSHPGSVGFVVSQDGDIRAMTRVGGRLVLWEHIRLQEVEVVAPRRQSRDVAG